MRNHIRIPMFALTAGATLVCSTLQAASVTDWHTFRASPGTTLSGQATDDPIFGSLSQTSNQGVLVGYLNAPLSLVNVGDKITFSYDVSFNDTTGMTANTPDQFRFALFSLNGESKVTADNIIGAGGTTDTDNLRGYWLGVKSGTGAQGSIRKRAGTTSDVNPFANASGTLLGTAGGTSITYSGAVNGVGGALYSGSMTLELQSGGVLITGAFTGNGGANSFSYLDTTSPYTSGFESVAFLNGGSLGAEQILFQNVNVTLVPVPEPSMVALGSIGLLALAVRRFRQ